MPGAAGPGNGAAHRRAAIHCFLLDRLPTARIVTASTFNEDSFYDYYEIGEWEGVDVLQGITCRELADRYNREDALARTAIGSLCVICKEGWYDGGLWNDTTTATVLNELERNTGRKVWWLNFHD